MRVILIDFGCQTNLAFLGRYVILFVYGWIQVSNILFRIFAPLLCDFCCSLLLDSLFRFWCQGNAGRVKYKCPFLSVFWRTL